MYDGKTRTTTSRLFDGAEAPLVNIWQTRTRKMIRSQGTRVSYLNAALGIYARIAFYIGCFGFFTESRAIANPPPIILFGPSLMRDVVYVGTGLLLVCCTGTLLGNVRIAGPIMQYNLYREHWSFLVAIALFGKVLLWIGIYDFIDLHVHIQVSLGSQKNTELVQWMLSIASGIVLLFLTRTLFFVSRSVPRSNKREVSNPWGIYFFSAMRAIVAIVAINVILVPTWRILLNYTPEFWEQVFAVAAGLGGMLLTCTFLASSQIPHAFPELGYYNIFCASPPWTYLRALLALSAQIIHDTAFWLLLRRICPHAKWRDPLFVLVGLVMMYFANAIPGNAGVDPRLFYLRSEQLVGRQFWFAGRVYQTTSMIAHDDPNINRKTHISPRHSIYKTHRTSSLSPTHTKYKDQASVASSISNQKADLPWITDRLSNVSEHRVDSANFFFPCESKFVNVRPLDNQGLQCSRDDDSGPFTLDSKPGEEVRLNATSFGNYTNKETCLIDKGDNTKDGVNLIPIKNCSL